MTAVGGVDSALCVYLTRQFYVPPKATFINAMHFCLLPELIIANLRLESAFATPKIRARKNFSIFLKKTVDRKNGQ